MVIFTVKYLFVKQKSYKRLRRGKKVQWLEHTGMKASKPRTPCLCPHSLALRPGRAKSQLPEPQFPPLSNDMVIPARIFERVATSLRLDYVCKSNWQKLRSLTLTNYLYS